MHIPRVQGSVLAAFFSSPIFSCAISNSLQRSGCRFGLSTLHRYQPPVSAHALQGLCAGRHCIPIEVSAFYWRSVARLAGRIRPPLRPSLGLLPAHRSRAVISSARGTAGCLRFLLSAAHCRRGIICGPLPLYYLSYLCRCALHNSRSYRLCRRGVARTVLRAHVYQPIIKKRKEWLACISHVHMSRRRGRRDETTVRRKRGN